LDPPPPVFAGHFPFPPWWWDEKGRLPTSGVLPFFSRGAPSFLFSSAYSGFGRTVGLGWNFSLHPFFLSVRALPSASSLLGLGKFTFPPNYNNMAPGPPPPRGTGFFLLPMYGRSQWLSVDQSGELVILFFPFPPCFGKHFPTSHVNVKGLFFPTPLLLPRRGLSARMFSSVLSFSGPKLFFKTSVPGKHSSFGFFRFFLWQTKYPKYICFSRPLFVG